MKKDMSYEQALEELQAIVEEIENGETGIDELAAKIKRASELLNFCKTKLVSTEKDVEKILESLRSEG